MKVVLKNLTISSSSGTLLNKSRTSLFGTTCGRIKRLENFISPHANNMIRIGI